MMPAPQATSEARASEMRTVTDPACGRPGCGNGRLCKDFSESSTSLQLPPTW